MSWPPEGFVPAGPQSARIACVACGAIGYPGGSWMVPHRAGHAPCPKCGKPLPVKGDGTPRVHTRCPRGALPRGVAGVGSEVTGRGESPTEGGAMANEVQDYLTLTFVVRRPAELGELHEVEFEEARALVTDDETQFYSLRPGVSVEARAMGAEPGDWV